jgi:acylphosphatase
MNTRLVAKIYGRVQMVMFRDFTMRKARGLGLVGTVRNMSDGSVFVVAEGEEEKLSELLQKLHEGSLLSKVEHIEMSFEEPSGEFTSFNIAYD